MLTRRIALNAGDLNSLWDIEATYHPKADLTDIYKLLCQAYYGPTHMGRELALIRKSLAEELKQNRKIYLPLLQDIGNRKGFYRVSLDLIPFLPKQGEAPVPLSSIPKKLSRTQPSEAQIDYMALLIQESCLEMDVDLRSWKATWRRLWPRIEARYKPSKEITETVVQHVLTADITKHSKNYKSLYQPHYRILHHKLLKTVFDIEA
ncbi:MAG TPA: hypothetical protein PL126_01985 [Candidatus Cloacimonadota bacterium]|nr:hypothetical protein [Candidatus Cloacimonadota bacterium]